jgi:hypothetical protein
VEDDLIHAAKAVAAQAEWLITSDRRFKAVYSKTLQEVGNLHLILPSEFIREIDELARGDRYRPVDLAGTSVTIREVGSQAVSGLAETFVSHGQGERIRDLRRAIELAAARPLMTHLDLVEVDGRARALSCWEIRDGELQALILRVTSGHGETTLGRHLLGRLREHAVASRIETIRVLDGSPSVSVQRTFSDEGFAVGPGDVVFAHALSGIGRLENLRVRARTFGARDEDRSVVPNAGGDIAEAAAAERWFAPVRVVAAGIPTFVVPIRPPWAKALFNVGLVQDELFAREWSLGLRRELVYYRSPVNSRGLQAPARILWYVSAGGKPGAGAIQATSHLIEVATGPSQRLSYRFRPLGVYTRQQVEDCANKGEAMALRISHTELFDRPVWLRDYEQIMATTADPRRIVLRSPQEVSEHVFVSVLKRGLARDF